MNATPIEGWKKAIEQDRLTSQRDASKPCAFGICASCETVSWCMGNGCLPITMEEPARKWNVLATCFWIAASGICTAFVVAAIRYAT